MGTRRNQAHAALDVPAAAMIATDCQQPSELALAACIGLQADGVVTSDLDQRRLKLGNHRAVTDGLVIRCVRVDIRELRPRNRFHLTRRVEFHRA